MLRKALSAMLAAVLLTLFAAVPVAAVAPFYEFGEAYAASPYAEALGEVVLTGDGRYDALAVAFSQLGYHEGDDESEMDGANPSGSRNFVEYNRLYGKLDNGEGNGVSYGYSWCAAFVSWCLRHAGVDEAVAVTEVSCRRMLNWYREQGAYYVRSCGYTPRPGDLIMFQSGDGVATHVGLVVGAQRGRVYVIDGNGKEEMVTTHVYHRHDRKILGYCVPDYEAVEGTVYDFPMMAGSMSRGTTTALVALAALVSVCLIGLALYVGRQIKRARE